MPTENFCLCLSAAQKRQSSVRKQQLTAATVFTEHPADETDQLPESTPLFILNAQSMSFPDDVDSYSFADIDVASSINEPRVFDPSATPKSMVSYNLSLATTNLSSCSTQSLLRKLLEKAQLLDDYYKGLSRKPHNRSVSSLSLSSTSLLGKSEVTPRSYFHRCQSQRRNRRNLYDTISAESSRFNLYVDEDNVLRELVRFNNNIDLILSRLATDGETTQATTNDLPADENLFLQTAVDPLVGSAQVNHDRYGFLTE